MEHLTKKDTTCQTRKILFVCTGNTCRSPLAQFYASSISDKFEFDSAGTNVTEKNINANSARILQVNNLDFTDFRPKQINKDLIRNSCLIITMTKKQADLLSQKYDFAQDRIYSIGKFSGYEEDIIDPFGKDINFYEKTYMQIKKQISAAKQKW